MAKSNVVTSLESTGKFQDLGAVAETSRKLNSLKQYMNSLRLQVSAQIINQIFINSGPVYQALSKLDGLKSVVEASFRVGSNCAISIGTSTGNPCILNDHSLKPASELRSVLRRLFENPYIEVAHLSAPSTTVSSSPGQIESARQARESFVQSGLSDYQQFIARNPNYRDWNSFTRTDRNSEWLYSSARFPNFVLTDYEGFDAPNSIYSRSPMAQLDTLGEEAAQLTAAFTAKVTAIPEAGRAGPALGTIESMLQRLRILRASLQSSAPQNSNQLAN